MSKNRDKEFEMVKDTIRDYQREARCGMYNTRNVVGDSMMNIFEGNYFKIDICFRYEYFEVFGCTDKEFNELKEFYYKLDGGEE